MNEFMNASLSQFRRKKSCGSIGQLVLVLVLVAASVSSARAQQPVVTLEAVDSFNSELFVALVEENAGTTQFRVKLSAPGTQTVNVLFATGLTRYRGDHLDFNDPIIGLGLCFDINAFPGSGGCTATPGSDFYGVAKEVIFEPGETQKTVAVQILDNRYAELNQAFDARLLRPRNAVLPRRIDMRSAAEWTVFIKDDDVSPTGSDLSISVPADGPNPGGFPSIVDEGAGTVEATVRLIPASPLPVEVTVYTVAVNAQDGLDYEGIPRQRLVFAPGETSKPIPIVINDDSIEEQNEIFEFRLEQAVGATISLAHPEFGYPRILIVDNDRVPEIRLFTFTDSEREFSPVAKVIVSADAELSRPVTAFVYTRSTGSAQPGSDYYGIAQRIELNPGSFSGTTQIDIPLLNDQIAESTESFEVRLVNVENATTSTPSLTIFIDDDD